MEQLYVSGKEYWAILKRFHARRTEPLMRRVAVRDMRELLSRTREPSLRARIMKFINVNRPQSPGNNDGGDGRCGGNDHDLEGLPPQSLC